MLRLTQSLSFTEDTGLWPLRHGRNLQFTKDMTEEEMCAYTTWMKVTYWALAGVWVAFFLVWLALVLSPGKRRRGLRLFLFVLPLVMFGNSVVQIDVYTSCPCLQCRLGSAALAASIYTFHIGRLVVFPLSLYVIATGCGTIYAQVPTRGWLVVVFVFGGFATALGCSIVPNPNQTVAGAIATLLYAAVYLTVLAEAVVSCKVLKAQLLMIRERRIDPRTCPAWAKFRLFTSLRRYVCAYLTVEAVSIVLSLLQLPLLWDGISTLLWELVQVCIAGALGWVFGGTSFNRFVESERHMLPSEITTLLAPADMNLEWQDEGGEALSEWQASSLVPPPPEAPALISAFGHGRTANQAALDRARAARSAPALEPAAPAAPTRTSTLRDTDPDPGVARHERASAAVELGSVAATARGDNQGTQAAPAVAASAAAPAAGAGAAPQA